MVNSILGLLMYLLAVGDINEVDSKHGYTNK